MHTELGKYETAAAMARENATIKRMDETLRSVDAQIMEILAKDPDVLKNYNLVSSIKGIGLLNAVKFKLILRMFAVVKSGQPYKVLNY